MRELKKYIVTFKDVLHYILFLVLLCFLLQANHIHPEESKHVKAEAFDKHILTHAQKVQLNMESEDVSVMHICYAYVTFFLGCFFFLVPTEKNNYKLYFKLQTMCCITSVSCLRND